VAASADEETREAPVPEYTEPVENEGSIQIQEASKSAEAQLLELIQQLEFKYDSGAGVRRRVQPKDNEKPSELHQPPMPPEVNGLYNLLHLPPDVGGLRGGAKLPNSTKMMMIGPDGKPQAIDAEFLKSLEGSAFFQYGTVPGAHAEGSAEEPYYIGAIVTDASEEVKRHLGLDENVGVVVMELIEGAPAKKAGIKENDIVVRVNGDFIGNREGLIMAIQEASDKEMELEIVSRGVTKTIKLKAAKREKPKILSTPFVPKVDPGMQHLLHFPGMVPHELLKDGFLTLPEVPALEIESLRKEVRENRALLEKILERLDSDK